MDIIQELERRIAAKRKELEDEEHALLVVRRMMGQSNVQSPRNADQYKPEQQGAIKFEELIGSVEKTKKRTLLDEIRDVVSTFGDNEFSVAHIEAALNTKGYKFDAKSPRARIGIVLMNLIEEEFVVRTFTGAGNVPHRYKLRTALKP